MSCYNVYYIDLTLLFTLIRRIKKELVVHCQMLQLPVESVPIATKVVSFNPVHGEVYSIQHYVIKFVSDL